MPAPKGIRGDAHRGQAGNDPYAVETSLLSTDAGKGGDLVGYGDELGNYPATVETVTDALDVIGEALVEKITVTIATGDVATLNATPVELVPAPGAGLMTVVTSIHWWLDFESAAYDGVAAGENLVAKYTNAAGDAVVSGVTGTGFGDAAADAHAIADSVSTVAPVENAAIVAHILVGEWYAAAGDSPLKATVYYRTLPFTW